MFRNQIQVEIALKLNLDALSAELIRFTTDKGMIYQLKFSFIL